MKRNLNSVKKVKPGLYLTAVGNKMVAQRIAEAEETRLVIIPDSAKEDPQEAVLLSVGPEAKRVLKLKEHDRVLVKKYVTEVQVENGKFLFLEPQDVLCIVDRRMEATDGDT